MCLSTVIKNSAEGTEELCNNISSFEVAADGAITFTDLLGDQTTVSGVIERVDFVEGRIYLTA